MPKAKDLFSYDIEPFASLREPARAVVSAYQTANRFFDTVQEYVYIEQGMPFLSHAIHARAHEFPLRFDTFIDMLHERHLMGEYPATPELDWRAELKDLDDVFSIIIRVLDTIRKALEDFRAKTDNSDFREMALKTEELMLQNSADYTKFLQAWVRWDEEGGSKTSFDSWCRHFFDIGD